MMRRSIDGLQADALVQVVRAIRRDWDERGIRAACRDAWERHTCTYPELAVAAIRAAATPSNLTPAVIALGGKHWQPVDPADDRRPEARTHCGDCGWFHTRTEPCQRPEPVAADTGSHIAAARAAIRHTKTYQPEEDAE